MIAGTAFRLAVVVGLALAWAAPVSAQQPNNPPSSSSYYQSAPPPACPPGTHWEEAGYIGHGKYRPARCARDDGKE